MKTRAFAGLVAAVSLGTLSGCVTTTGAYYSDPGAETAAPEVGASVSVSTFDDALSPYGEWVVSPQYGRVWRPSPMVVGAEFVPYQTGGHWVSTDIGWSWASDYDWGWAPFHYGRWYMDPVIGWVWVPATTWAPAWVEWRYGGGYVGWAPMGPYGYAGYGYRSPWFFTETRYMVYGDVYRYRVAPSNYHQAFAVTQLQREPMRYGGASWYAGPPREHVAAAVGHPIQPVRVQPPRPGQIQPVRPGYAGTPPGGRAGYANTPPGGRGSISAPPGGMNRGAAEPGTPGFARPPAAMNRAPGAAPTYQRPPPAGGYGRPSPMAQQRMGNSGGYGGSGAPRMAAPAPAPRSMGASRGTPHAAPPAGRRR